MKKKIVDFIVVALIVPIVIGFYAVETNYRGFFRTPTPASVHVSTVTRTPTITATPTRTPAVTPKATQTRTPVPNPSMTSTRIFTLQLPPDIQSSAGTGVP